MRQKQNFFVNSYNEFIVYITNKYEKFDDRFDQIDNKLNLFNLNNKMKKEINVLKNKLNVVIQNIVDVFVQKVVQIC